MKFILIMIFTFNSILLFSQSDISYKIYSLIIKENFNKSKTKIAVKNITSLFVSLSDSDFLFFKQNLNELRKETFDSFLKNNMYSDTIKNRFNLRKDILIIDKEYIKEIFKEDNGWELFYSKYGKTQGILTLSKIGFSSNMDQALIYYGNQSDYLAGGGFYVLLIKKGEKWIIKSKLMAWIS